MKGERQTKQQILDILGRVEAGQLIAEVARTMGVVLTTLHRWKAHHGEMTKDETKRYRGGYYRHLLLPVTRSSSCCSA